MVENFTVPGYYFGGEWLFAGVTEPKKKLWYCIKNGKERNGIDSDRYPSILEGRCWNRGLVGLWPFWIGTFLLYEKIIELRKVTVDGRNPAPQSFLHPRWLFGMSSINSRTGQGFNVSSCWPRGGICDSWGQWVTASGKSQSSIENHLAIREDSGMIRDD